MNGSGSPPGDDRLDAAARDEIDRLLAERRKIEAVKRYREAAGVGLKEAKLAVEARARELDPEGHTKAIGPRGGCSGSVVLVLATAAVVAVLLA